MAFGIQQQVFELEVSVCDLLDLVEEFDDQKNLGGVEACYRDFESACPLEVREEFPAGAIVKLAT